MQTVDPLREAGSAGHVELRVYRHGWLTARELCSSYEQAIARARELGDQPGVEVTIDDVTVSHHLHDGDPATSDGTEIEWGRAED